MIDYDVVYTAAKSSAPPGKVKSADQVESVAKAVWVWINDFVGPFASKNEFAYRAGVAIKRHWDREIQFSDCGPA